MIKAMLSEQEKQQIHGLVLQSVTVRSRMPEALKIVQRRQGLGLG